MLLYMSMVRNKKKKKAFNMFINIRAVCFDMPKEADESLVGFGMVVICVPVPLNSYKMLTFEL